MFKLILMLTSLVISFQTKATIKIAEIDTGFDFKSTWSNSNKFGLSKPKLCKEGHYNFINNTDYPQDNHGHGTHIAGLIAENNQKSDYCLIILKYFDVKEPEIESNVELSNKALKKAIELKVDIINYSGGGSSYNKEECSLIKKALNKGIRVIVAAGNASNYPYGADLSKTSYYPAECDSRLEVVGNLESLVKTNPTSNFGCTVQFWEIGTNVLSLGLNNTYVSLTGTSQATAIRTSKLVKELNNVYNLYKKSNTKVLKSQELGRTPSLLKK